MKKPTLLDPTSDGPGVTKSPAPRLGDLRGTRGGFRRQWLNFDTFVDRIEELMSEQYEVETAARAGGTFAERSGDKLERWRRFKAQVDWAVVGLGACWGTAPWSVYDAIELEQEGKPTVVVVTDEFAGLAKETGVAEGCPSLPTVVLPHFFEELSKDAVRKLAEENYAEIVAGLTVGQARVER